MYHGRTTSLLIVIFCLIITQYSKASDNPFRYSLKDLEILEAEGSYDEFLAHAKDIPPSQRTEHWEQLVHNMAEELINSFLKKNIVNRKAFLKIESLTSWASLKNDEFFWFKRADFGSKYLKNCFKESDHRSCIRDLDNIWNNTPTNKITPDLAYGLGLIKAKYGSKKDDWKSLWPFYSFAINSNFSEHYCQKGPIQAVIFQKLQSILTKDRNNPKLKNKLESIIPSKCWPHLEKAINQYLISNNKTLASQAYTVLKTLNKISDLSSSTYLAKYILEGPKIGDKFNEAWGAMVRLGQNYERREKVLKLLLAYDPLPDKIFAHKNKQKRDIVVNLVADNFPEYLKGYANLCLKYLSGKGTFPNGNPTVHCHKFFNLSAGKKWINQNLHTKYNKLVHK